MHKVRRMVPANQEERVRVAGQRRARAILEEHSNRVADVIFARTKRVPNMRLVEGLPKSRAEIEKQIEFLKRYKTHAQESEGFKKHGPKFIQLYDLIAKTFGFKLDSKFTTQVLDKHYFPTPQIKQLITEIKKEIMADASVSEEAKRNVAVTLKSFSQRRAIRQFSKAMLADRAFLLNAIARKPLRSTAETDRLIERLNALRQKLPAGEFNPIQQAEIYLQLYAK